MSLFLCSVTYISTFLSILPTLNLPIFHILSVHLMFLWKMNENSIIILKRWLLLALWAFFFFKQFDSLLVCQLMKDNDPKNFLVLSSSHMSLLVLPQTPRFHQLLIIVILNYYFLYLTFFTWYISLILQTF